jgi:hypothetical protein
MKRQTISNLQYRPLILKKAALLFLIAAFGVGCQRTLKKPDIISIQKREEWKAGVASVVITPEQSMWMAGYAARTKPSDGKVHDLHAKAIALEDFQGARLIIVTVDLLGIPRSLRDWLEKEVTRCHKIPPAFLLLNASHTHCGPVLKEARDSIYGNSFYGLSPEQIQQSEQYTEALQEKLLQLIGQAINNLAPARLSYTHARAGFAMNRRLKTKNGYQILPNPDGPVDHDVPVLRVDSPDGKLQAVLFGYACHNTSLSFYKFCGDYAGFAQQYLEEAHPGVRALFVSGCGGDQNPYPRASENIDYCMQHGRALANAVETSLVCPPQTIRGPLHAAIDSVTLQFAKPPSRERLKEQEKSSNKYERWHAQVLLKELEQKGKIRTTYPYLIQAVRFGNELTIVALSGEVVVDYSLRLKATPGSPTVWVAGYSNDVFGYVPSLRILQEGGYEGGDAMLYTDLPGPFRPSVEKRILDKVHELVRKVRAQKGN